MKYTKKKLSILCTFIMFAILSVIVLGRSERQVEAAGSRTIADGIYKICASSSSQYVLSVEGASDSNGANVLLDSSSDASSQMFSIVYDGQGYYTIYSVSSGKVLDVCGNGSANGTNIQQYESNNTAAQKWKIIKNNDGTYSFVAKNCGKYMDIQNSNVKRYSNIWIYDGNGTAAQKFSLKQVTDLPDGTYTIASAMDNNKVVDIYVGSLDSGANVQLYQSNGSNAQKFRISKNGDGTYSIVNEGSDKALDVYANGTADNTNVQQYESNGSAAQKWKIVFNDGYFNIISASSGKYLDVSDGKTDNGTNIKIYSANGSTAQKFSFVPTRYKYSVSDGTYALSCYNNRDMVVDIFGASEQNGANAQIYKWNGSNAQKFVFRQIGNGYYQITNVCSGKALDVSGAKTTPGTNVDQYDINGTAAQMWKLYPVGDGSYYLQAKCSGLVLDVDNGYMTNGNNVKTYTWTGNRAQTFFINPTTPNNKGWIVSGNRKYYYTNNGELKTKFGIDVSRHNGTIDWQSVKNSGVEYAIIRVGFGDNMESQDDVKAVYNMNECERLGIPYGVYLYSYATNDEQANSEADHIIRMLQGRNPSIGVYIDIEDTATYSAAGINIYSTDGRNKLTRWANIVVDKVSSHGYKAGVYANLNYFTSVLYADQLRGDKWLACYRSLDAACPAGDWNIWQYADDGSIPGINGAVDLDVLIK